MKVKTILIVAGLLIALISLSAEYIGLGSGGGIGFKQSSGAVLGVALLLFGLFKKNKPEDKPA